jgi:nitrous oxidase accessory protein
MSKRIILICVFLLFLGSLRLDVGSAEQSGGSIIHVPADYTRIGWAVGNATDGDTILVSSGFYQENVVVDKPLKIVGESKELTVVDCGGFNYTTISKGFSVMSDNVLIENFTITNAYRGIYVENATNVTIANNILILNNEGIKLNYSGQSSVKGNIATNNTFGITVGYCINCVVENNTATDNYGGPPDLRMGEGISLGSTNYTTISENYLARNLAGIVLGNCHNNTIARNLVVENKDPVTGGMGGGINIVLSDGNTAVNNTIVRDFIQVSHSNDNKVERNIFNNGGIGTRWSIGNVFGYNSMANGWAGFSMELAQDLFVGNLIVNNTEGFHIHYCNGSTFYHNILINNTVNLNKDVYTNVNVWDNGFEGNYWDNYTGIDADQDGIGDTPHALDEYNMDNHPLMAPINFFDAGTWNDTQQMINIISNSTITNFQLNATNSTLSFTVNGTAPTTGFCGLAIPNIIAQQMWNNNYIILVDNQPANITKNWTDATNTYIYFTYQHSKHEVMIIPELPRYMLLPLLMTATTIPILLKKKQKQATTHRMRNSPHT